MELPSLLPGQQVARQQVLARLEAHPAVKRAFMTRWEGDLLVVTLAIRGVGTGELAIARDSLGRPQDFAALLECLEGHA